MPMASTGSDEVRSPDGRLAVQLSLAEGAPVFTVKLDDRTVLDDRQGGGVGGLVDHLHAGLGPFVGGAGGSGVAEFEQPLDLAAAAMNERGFAVEGGHLAGKGRDQLRIFKGGTADLVHAPGPAHQTSPSVSSKPRATFMF